MTMEELINRFIEVKQNQPSTVDELLDFVQNCYIRDELCIVNYRSLYKELDAKGAKKPDYYTKEMIC